MSAQPAGSADSSCLFCRIVAGEIPADVVAEDERALAFRDIAPKAPTHVLVIPRVHAPDLVSLGALAPESLTAVVRLIGQVAKLEGVSDYRTVFNTGAGAGQTVWHAHAHVLAGPSLPE